MRRFDFPTIPVAAPVEAIFRRMGLMEGVTTLSDKKRAAIMAAIATAMAAITLAGTAKTVAIAARSERELVLVGGAVFTSAKLVRFIGDAKGLLLLGASAGSGIAAALEEAKLRENLEQAVIFDATASEVVDNALSWMQAYIGTLLRREGYRFAPRRFSAGYGDFSLSHQRVFYDILALGEIGVSLTASFLLIPEKTVTAVCGFSCG